MKKDNLLVIVGAGGGIDIGMPSTEDLEKSIINPRCSNNFGRKEKDLISTILNHVIKSGENYEDLISIIEDLNTFTREVFDPNKGIDVDITPYLDLHCKMNETKTIAWNAPDYTINSIYKEIFDKINESQSKKFDFEVKHKWYSDFYKEIDKKYNICIVTTNHDNSYKITLESLNNGFSIVKDKTNGIFQFNPEDFFQKIAQKPILMNIHGSIHYGFSDEPNKTTRIIEENDLLYFEKPEEAYNTWFDRANHNISQDNKCFKMGPFVEGLNKLNKIIISPLFFYLSSLYKLILSCNKMLIIGYSFSDVHLNWYIKKFKDIHGANSRIIYITYVKRSGDNSLKWMRLDEKQKNFLNHFGNSWNNLRNSRNREQFSLSDNLCCAIWFDGFESFTRNGSEERLEFLGLKEK